ncbi:MAG: universal stress protein [Vicinamibacterales bacterium]
MTDMPLYLVGLGAIAVAVWMALVYLTLFGIGSAETAPAPFGALLGSASTAGAPRALRVLLAVDGSPASAAAVDEVARSPLPDGSVVAVVTVVHSRAPVMPDIPPWGLTAAAVHADSVHAQTRDAPALLDAAAAHIKASQPRADVETKVVEGVPKDAILQESAAWRADRIVVGSHGRTALARAVLGTTAADIAAEAQCSVHVVRPGPAAATAASPVPVGERA